MRAQRIQCGRHRAVLATHQIVAGGGIVAGFRKRLQGGVVVLLQLRVQADEGLCQFARAYVRAGYEAPGQLLDQAALAVEGVQMALAQRVVVAAQQHVLPFLHLAAELALQAFGVAAVRDFGWNLGGQLQPGGGQARQCAQQDHGQTNRNRAEQRTAGAEHGQTLSWKGLSGRGNAVSTCPHASEVRRSSHYRFV